MNSRLIIIGAGGFGREVFAWARDSLPALVIAGFLDDNHPAMDDRRLPAPVLSKVQNYEPQPEDLFLCAVGNPSLRRALSTSIKQRGGRFQTLIHPTAVVAESACLDEGVLVCPFALVSVDVQIAEGAAVYYHSSVDHDARIGAWSQISAHCDITGGAVIGEEVFVGSHASILPRVRVGDRAIVGAGAVVTQDVAAGSTVYGVPARIRSRDASEA